MHYSMCRYHQKKDGGIDKMAEAVRILEAARL